MCTKDLLCPVRITLSSYPDSTGPVGLWLSRDQRKITVLTLSHWIHSLELPHRLSCTCTCSTEHTHTQWNFLPFRSIRCGHLSSVRRTRTQATEEKQNTSESVHMADLWPAQRAQHTAYVICYLMISHTDIRTHCVVNDTLLTIVSLKRRMNLKIIYM